MLQAGNFSSSQKVVEAYFNRLANQVNTLICNIGMDCGVEKNDFTTQVTRRPDDTGFVLTVTPRNEIPHTLSTFFASMKEACKRHAPGASISREGDNIVFTCSHITDFRNVLSVLEKPYETLALSRSA